MREEKVSSWQDFVRELRGLITVTKWAFKMADAKEARHWLYIRYGALLARVILGPAQPAVISYVFASVVSKNLIELTVAIILLAVLMLLERVSIYYIWFAHEHLFGPAIHSIQKNITTRFFDKSPHQHKELKGLNHESMAKGKNRLSDLYLNDAPEAFEVATSIVIAYLFLWILVPVAGAIMTVLIAVYLSWSLYLNYHVVKECTQIEEEFTAFERHLASRWKFAERVIVSAKSDEELEELGTRWGKVIEKDRGFWLWHLKQVNMRDLVSVISELFIIIYGATLVYTGHWKSVGILYPLFSWTNVITSNIRRVGQLQRQIMGYLPTLKLMMQTLDVHPDVSDSPGSVDLSSQGSVELAFENVSYRYGKEVSGSSTISNVSFIVGSGERVALVGPSGSGKSTLQYLALRFMDPRSGEIRIDGVNINTIKLNSLRRAIAYIPQRPQIFDGTVRDNLLYALTAEERKAWNDDKLRGLMSSLAIDFGKRPEGENPLDIVVGREGVQLSGGQSQRLAIGAAVIRKPRLMLIDEATSHLDSTTEKAVLEGLNELMVGITTLVIAHRLSTVRTADKVVVLVNGSVEAVGSSFEELLRTSSTFKQLAEHQNLEIV